MESIEDEKRQRQTRDDSPCQETVEREVQFLRHPVVCHERVEQPERDISEEEESHNLPAGFEHHLVSRGAHALAGLGDKHALHRGLDEQQPVADEDHDMLLVVQIRSAHNQTCTIFVFQTGISEVLLHVV